MTDEVIKVKKVNEVYMKLEAERYIIKEVSEHFTFLVPGHKFNPAFKNRMWDGKIRLLDTRNNHLYIGLLEYLEKFAKDRGYKLECESRLETSDDFSVNIAEQFIKKLNLHSGNNKIEVREHQLNALIHVMRKKRCLLLSPTASGKSLIIYLIMRMMIYKNMKGLIIVPRTSLVEQLSSDFIDYSTANNFDCKENVHKLYAGHDKNTEKKVIISTWQSIYNMPKEFFEQFDYVIGDEAHEFKAKSLVSIMTNSINTKYRIGLTGTLDGTKTHQFVLEGLFGSVKRVTTTKELIEKKELSQFQIKCLVLKHNENISKEIKKKKSYQDEIDYLISCEERNKFIKNLVLSLKNNTLILYQYVDRHGQLLYDIVSKDKNLNNRKVFFIHGSVSVEEREEIRKSVESENNAIIIASYGTYSTGINIKNLHNIIFASPSKSRVRNLQSIGRGLRLSSNKEEAVLFDISDDMRVDSYDNFTLKHFIERVKIYNEEKFKYKLYKINLSKE
jgi:superfamily II DNA or RNA helicase